MSVESITAVKKALLCWDGSESAERAVQQAGGILVRSSTAILLFAYVPTESSRGVLSGPSGPDAPVMGPADAEELLECGVTVARGAGFEVRPLLVTAERRTAEIVAATADEQEVDLIVMGQRERSALGTLVLGSVTRDVLRSYHRPVLLVGPSGPGSLPERR
jgi:nucleotide-binding universal stress UspA family protein